MLRPLTIAEAYFKEADELLEKSKTEEISRDATIPWRLSGPLQ